MIGTITGRDVPAERVIESVAAALIAAQQGALILRVHDVVETREALAVLAALQPFRRRKPAAAAKPFGSMRWDDDV